jgi:hypothetical protein
MSFKTVVASIKTNVVAGVKFLFLPFTFALDIAAAIYAVLVIAAAVKAPVLFGYFIISVASLLAFKHVALFAFLIAFIVGVMFMYIQRKNVIDVTPS